MDLISNASFMALGRFAIHFLRKLYKQSTKPSRSSRMIPWSLTLAALGLGLITSLSVGIKIIDIVLHKQIQSTLMPVDSMRRGFKARATVSSACGDGSDNTCQVLNRSNVASLGGRNLSSEFRVYEAADQKHGSMAYIGPAQPDAGISVTSQTVVAATSCAVYHPSCFVQDMVIQGCSAANADRGRLYTGFNTTRWEMRIQMDLENQGTLKHGGPLTNGGNTNPLTIVSFGCFKDYTGILYSDTDVNFKPPFINWWTYGQGIGNKPYILCSISECNTTVYDAEYAVSNGSISLNTDSLTLANASTILAVSGAATHIGTDTDFYRYSSRYLDDSVQLDLEEAGNQFGNDTERFATAWGQSLSNRLLGWAVGAITLDPVTVTATDTPLAISIPLSTSYVFVALHFAYAAGILFLGISCLFIPSTLNIGESAAISVQDAHERLNDPYTIVRELLQAKSQGDNLELGSPRSRTDSVVSVRSGWTSVDEGKLADVKIGLRPEDDGRVRLDFRS